MRASIQGDALQIRSQVADLVTSKIVKETSSAMICCKLSFTWFSCKAPSRVSGHECNLLVVHICQGTHWSHTCLFSGQAERVRPQEQAVIQVLGKPGKAGKEHSANAKFWATEGQMRVVANVQASATGSYAPAAAR